MEHVIPELYLEVICFFEAEYYTFSNSLFVLWNNLQQSKSKLESLT